MSALENIDWQEILKHLIQLATSESAREILKKTAPLTNAHEAASSGKLICEFLGIIESGQRPFMESLDLYGTWFPRLEKKATLRTLELKDVRHFCIECLALKEILSGFTEPHLSHLQKSLFAAEEPLTAIDQLMTPDGDIRLEASETLFKLNREKNQLSREIQHSLDRLVKKHDLEGIIQDRYVTTREGRWVLPVRSGMQSRFEGIIHASSQSKQTVFMEPQEIISQNNRIREIEVAIENEIERLLRALTEYLSTLTKEIDSARNILIQADTKLAQAQLAHMIQGSIPHFSPNQETLELIDVRHPLLVIKHEKVIANTVRLNRQERILLLSGPNAGGKTVLLKSIGLAAQMARCGLLICAQPGSQLPFFSQIEAAVGDAQSVDAHLSTFAAHLQILNRSTELNGSQQLLLIDEICGSTDPEEGAALARSFIESYSKKYLFAIITSHLGPLKSGWNDESGVIHGSLEYDHGTGLPTFQLIRGIPGQSMAIKTAYRVGVHQDIINQALHYLSPERQKLHHQLENLDSTQLELEKMKSALQNEFREMQKAKSKYESLVQKFQKEKETMLNQALKRAESKVERMIEFAQVDQTFKKHETLQKIKHHLPEMIKSSPSSSPTSAKISSPEEFSRRFPPGKRVFVTGIGRDAVIQGTPNAKGEVPILSNSMRLMVPWSALKAPQQPQNPTADIIRKTSSFTYSPSDQDRTVDLRGLSVEEALSQLEIQLDTAALNQEERVKIIHGHGIEALKRAIRSYLSRSIYIKKWTRGDKSAEGDGITWVELNED